MKTQGSTVVVRDEGATEDWGEGAGVGSSSTSSDAYSSRAT